MSNIHQTTLSNGLTLLAEPIAGAQSLAMTWLLPAGVAHEPANRLGLSGLLSEMINRGAGGLSAREHSDALDTLGVDRSSSAETQFMRLSATMIGSKLDDALPLLVDMVRRPNLAEESLEPSRALALQSIESLRDEPQQRVMLELRARHHPSPLGRSPYGDPDDIKAATLDDIRGLAQRGFVPGGSILAFAGKFDWDHLQKLVERLLGDWQGRCEPVDTHAPPPRAYEAVEADTTQVHIALAYDAVPERDSESIFQRMVAAVLSGGTASRLFTEVREKRGLCYAVSASYASFRDRGFMVGYAGTTVARAQETLAVMVQELRRLREGVTEAELNRAFVGFKSRLVMQGESTSARALSIALDQHLLGQPRTLDERTAELDRVTLEALNRYVADHPVGEMTVVTLGPQALSHTPAEVAEA